MTNSIPTKTRWRRTGTAVRLALAVGLLVAGAVATLSDIGPAGAASAPPFEPDPNSSGFLTFYNASGAAVTTGNVGDAPFAAFAQASGAGRSGDNKATLFGALPKSGQPSGAWSSEQMSGSTTYPNSNAPAALKSSPLPLVSLTSSDETLAQLQGDFPNTAPSGDPYQGLYQLRLKTSGPGQAPGSQYFETVIQITGSTWTQVYPAPGSTPPTTTPTTVAGGSTTTTASGGSTSTTVAGGSTTTTVAGGSTTTTTAVGGSTTTTTTTTTATATDASGSPLAANTTLTPGQKITVTASGFTPNESVAVAAHSATVSLGSVTADAAGKVTASITLPTSLDAGAHTITLTGASRVASYPFTVAASSTGGTSGSSSSSGSGALPRTGRQILGTAGAGLGVFLLGAAVVGWARRRVPAWRHRV
ncbi:MAG: hypothetical protein JO087_16770 [Actinobacteria bacterium]|nr:hypothetical protein [Actinomycetota bacterium]